MTGWIFGSAMGVLLVVGAILLCIFVPEARKFVLSFVAIIFVGLSTYCGIQLNFYYSAEGGIYGYINGLLGVNISTKIEDMKFSLNNIVLTQDDGDEFSALIYPDEVISLENDKDYTIFVNNVPLIPVDASNNFIIADYTYTFYNDDMTIALVDSLRFNLSFDDYLTTFKITTFGGQTAVNYWNSYFAKNKLEIEIKESLYDFNKKSEIIEIPAQETVTLTYYVNDEEFSKIIYPLGTEVKVFLTPTIEGKFFDGWSLDGTIAIQSLTMNKDYSLYAILIDEIVVFEGAYSLNNFGVSSVSIDLNEEFDCDFTNKSFYMSIWVGITKGSATGNRNLIMYSNQNYGIEINSSNIGSIYIQENKLYIVANTVLDSLGIEIYKITLTS